MSHLAAQLTRKRTPRRPQPYDHLTKKVLWERLQDSQRRGSRAASKAEDLRVYLRSHSVTTTAMVEGSYRAGEIRDILNAGRKTP